MHRKGEKKGRPGVEWVVLHLDERFYVARAAATNGCDWLFTLDFAEAEFDDAPEGFAEDAAGHFGGAFLAVDKDDGHFRYLEAQFVGCVLHFYLEAVAVHADVVEVDGAQHLGAVALEAGRAVVNLHSKNLADVYGGVVRHYDTADRPVDHAYAVAVAAAYGKVCATIGTSLIKPLQVVRIVGEIGIHFEDVVVTVVKSPAEAGQVGCSQPLLPGPLKNEELVREFLNQVFNYCGCAVRAAVVYYKDVISSLEGEYLADNPRDILFLVVGRNDDYFFIHYLLSISLSISLTAASSCLSSPASSDAGSLYTRMSGSIWKFSR